jgi:hypothetical protein
VLNESPSLRMFAVSFLQVPWYSFIGSSTPRVWIRCSTSSRFFLLAGLGQVDSGVHPEGHCGAVDTDPWLEAPVAGVY